MAEAATTEAAVAMKVWVAAEARTAEWAMAVVCLAGTDAAAAA